MGIPPHPFTPCQVPEKFDSGKHTKAGNSKRHFGDKALEAFPLWDSSISALLPGELISWSCSSDIISSPVPLTGHQKLKHEYMGAILIRKAMLENVWTFGGDASFDGIRSQCCSWKRHEEKLRLSSTCGVESLKRSQEATCQGAGYGGLSILKMPEPTSMASCVEWSWLESNRQATHIALGIISLY